MTEQTDDQVIMIENGKYSARIINGVPYVQAKHLIELADEIRELKSKSDKDYPQDDYQNLENQAENADLLYSGLLMLDRKVDKLLADLTDYFDNDRPKYLSPPERLEAQQSLNRRLRKAMEDMPMGK